jgi:uncharacterized protein (TIRG00374 family)
MTRGAQLRVALLAIGSALFLLLVRRIGLTTIRRDLAATGWWFGAVLAAWGVGYVLNTATFALLLGPARARVGARRLLGVMVAGFAMNYVTPFVHMGGEPFRVLTLQEDVGGARAAFATISYKLLNVASTFCYWTIGLLVYVVAFAGPSKVAVFGLILMAAAMIAAAWLVRRSERLAPWIVSIHTRRRMWAPLARALDRHGAALQQIGRQLSELRARPNVWLGGLALETAARAVMGLEFFFILCALGSRASLATSICVDAGSSFLLNMFFFVPFELGVREGGLYLIAAALGLPAAVGVVAALVNRVRELFWIGAGLLWGHLLAASSARRGVATA